MRFVPSAGLAVVVAFLVVSCTALPVKPSTPSLHPTPAPPPGTPDSPAPSSPTPMPSIADPAENTNPNAIPVPTGLPDDYSQMDEVIQAYNEQVEQQLEQLPADAFTPNLELLGALVASLRIESVRWGACPSPAESAPELAPLEGQSLGEMFTTPILDYLNARGGAEGLQAALTGITLGGGEWQLQAQVFTTDVTGDFTSEVLIALLANNGDFINGPLFVFRCQDGQYTGGPVAEMAGQVLSARDPDPGIRAIVDMNGNRVPEIVLSYISVVGTHANFTREFRILEWDGEQFVDRIQSDGPRPYVAQVLNGDGHIWDSNGDDRPDLELSHGLGHDLETPRPERGDSDLWTWDREAAAFVLERTLAPQQLHFHLYAIWDGDAAVLRGEYDKALNKFYAQSLQNRGIDEWSPVPIPDAGGGPLVPSIAVRLVPDPDIHQQLTAYTAYRILLLDFARGDPDKPFVQHEIQNMLERLQKAYDEETAGKPYAQLALTFLEEYSRSEDLAAACQAAIDYAAAHAEEILTPLGGGYYGMGYAPEDICPFTASAATSQTPFPALVAQIPLAPEGERLTDLLLDSANHRLYATDSSGQLHILDTDSPTFLATLPAAGRLTLDAASNRLLVSPLEDGPLTVVDTAALTVTGVISPGGAIAIDPVRRRFFVGRITTAAVRAYDLFSLEPVGEIAQPGRPIYNPLRDELYLEYLSLYIADPETLTVTGKLSLGLSGEEYGWCEGCTVPRNVFVDSARKILVVELHTVAHAGPGTLPDPLYFDAATLEEITDLAQQPALENECVFRSVLAGPVEGYLYRERQYFYLHRYDQAVNLLVYNTDGRLVDWYDSRSLERTNPRTRQMYAGEWVYDLPSLTRLGRLPVAADCFGPLDAETGRIYGVSENTLLVFNESGGKPYTPPVSEAGPYTGGAVDTLVFSPDYARDRTVFTIPLHTHFTPYGWDGSLYRSQDGGQTWARLPARGRLALSPGFAVDHTLFAFGNGIARSTDGGDTWQPVERGLRFMNIRDLLISPNFAEDGTLFAFARYWDLTGDAGYPNGALYRSTNRGESWSLVFTDTLSLSNWKEIFAPQMSTRWPVVLRTESAGKTVVERSRDGGASWESIFELPDDVGSGWRFAFPPAAPSDPTILLYSDWAIYRSGDSGDTWEQVFSTPEGEPGHKALKEVRFAPGFEQNRTIFARADRRLFRSNDGGVSWQQVLATESGAGPARELTFSPAYEHDHTLYLSTETRLYRSVDGGNAWEEVLILQSDQPDAPNALL